MQVRSIWTLWLAAGISGAVVGLAIAHWTVGRPEAQFPQASADLPWGAPPPEASSETSGSRLRFGPAPIPSDWLHPADGAGAFPPDPATATQWIATVAARDYSDVIDAGAKEELGRMALSYVGADPLADEVWVWLINDPELAPKVREDLIEDLNENGFSDGNGRRATAEDLPLIESRIVLLEEHSPFAMDAVNAAAFAEAYKDLVEMWWRLSE